MFWSREQDHKSAEIAKLYSDGSLTVHSAGYTYLILLPNKNVKVGYTKDLYKRLQTLDREIGPIHVLAVLIGGRTREACTHIQFRDIRLLGESEQFELTPALIEFVATHRLPESEDVILALKRLADYQSKKFLDRQEKKWSDSS